MSQVAVLSNDSRLDEMLRASGFKCRRVGASELAQYSPSSHAPDALIVDVRSHHVVPPAVTAFHRQCPSSGIVLVCATLDTRLMLEAMRAGVKECVSEPLTAPALEEAIHRVIADVRPDAAGQVFVFVGAKGGVGTTTVAVNTAAALARGGQGQVLLVDMHLGHGDAGVFLGVEPRFSVADALDNLHRVDESFFRGLVEKTRVGIDLLGASERMMTTIDTERAHALLDFAMRTYQYTLVDVPRSAIAVLDAVEAASAIVVVASQELSALRNGARLAQMLRQRYGTARVKVAINRFDPRGDIAQTDVERVLGDCATHLIPSDYRTAVEAMNAGRPLVLEKQGRLAQSLKALANDLAGIPRRQRERSAGVLGRLAFRRA